MSSIVNTLPLSVMVKEATQSLHADVERLLQPMLVSVRGRDQYASILKMLYGYYHPLEQRLQSVLSPALLPDFFKRRKASFILNDLSRLGTSATSIPLCDCLPLMENTAHAFGVLYVLEGSTLGGRVITKMLLKNASLTIDENALTFFSGYGEETSSMWKTFLLALNQQEDADAVIHAANETFFYLKCWMQHAVFHDRD